MKRYRLVNKKRFYTFVTLTMLTVSLSLMLLVNQSVNGENLDKYEVVTVESGDTIWDIAKEYNNKYNDKYEDLREFVYIIKKENNIFGDTISPNQNIKIPKPL